MKKLILTILLLGLAGCGQVDLPMGASFEKEVLDIATLQNKFDVATEIKNKYNLKETKLITKIEHKDDVKVAVGEDGEFKPNMEISRWDGEVKMKLKPRLDDTSKTKKLDFENNKIKYKEDKKEYHFYEMKAGELLHGEELENDVYEFEIVLLEKPATNTITLDIETEGLDFFYQSELTREEIDEGAFRPENVIGSYAVYHSEKQGDYSKMGLKNYRAGKAFHIYRPKIIDSDGTEVWGELNITDNLLTVEIPQEFLDNAVYPVRHAAGLTFGWISAGASTATLYDVSSNRNWLWFNNPDYSGGAVNASSMSAFVKNLDSNNAQDVSMAIYTDYNSNQEPDMYITNGITDAVSVPASHDAVITADFSTSPSLTSQRYWLGTKSNVNASEDLLLYYDSGATGWRRAYKYYTGSLISWADYQSYSYTGEGDDYLYSIYATYTASGGGADRRIFTTE